HRRGEPAPHRPAAASAGGRAESAGRRPAGALRPHRGGEADPGHLLRRHEAPPGHRDDPDGAATADLPRRAHRRPGPAQPPHHVAAHPRPTGAPVSSARRLSTTAVNGWFAVNHRTPAGTYLALAWCAAIALAGY